MINDLEYQLKEADVIKNIRSNNYDRSCDPLNYKAHHSNIIDIVYDSSSSRRNNLSSSSEGEIISYLEEKEIIKT